MFLLDVRSGSFYVLVFIWVVLTVYATAFEPPRSSCYVISRGKRLFDFTQWIGKDFSFTDTENVDFTIRFCKDVQMRSTAGYVSYGRFSSFNYLTSNGNFTQSYNNGDLKGCENSGFDESGRSSQVSILCGSCPGVSTCKDPANCICGVTLDRSKCRATIVMAISCAPAGPLVPAGFTVGFNPRGREVVDNGITQWGYERMHLDYSFVTDQRQLSLYFSAPEAFAKAVRKPSVKVLPSKGLGVKLSGSAANGDAPTTESPTVLLINWQCEKQAKDPYQVSVTIPAEGYTPIVIVLGKQCEKRQKLENSGSNGWATFGVLSFIFTILGVMFCCAGFCYNTRVEHKHGLEALPGLTILSSSLEYASRSSGGYREAEAVTNIIGNPPVHDSTSRSSRTNQRHSDSKYGAV